MFYVEFVIEYGIGSYLVYLVKCHLMITLHDPNPNVPIHFETSAVRVSSQSTSPGEPEDLCSTTSKQHVVLPISNTPSDLICHLAHKTPLFGGHK